MSNTAWIEALADLQQQGEPCVLVTIIEERGSTPRNAGSKMVVSRERLYDTIGGGHLEYKAQQIAREMLEKRSRDTRLERFSLGASLGQCCGGATVLLFEPMGQPQAHIAVFGAGHVGRALVPLLAGRLAAWQAPGNATAARNAGIYGVLVLLVLIAITALMGAKPV